MSQLKYSFLENWFDKFCKNYQTIFLFKFQDFLYTILDKFVKIIMVLSGMYTNKGIFR